MKLRSVSAAISTIALVACAHASDGTPPPAPGIGNMQPDPACLLGVRTAQVEARDVDGGISLTFTAATRWVDDLRGRVRNSAADHGPGAQQGMGHNGRHGIGQGHGLRLGDMPVHHRRTLDVDHGEELVLLATDPRDTDALRWQVRARLEMIKAQPCANLGD